MFLALFMPVEEKGCILIFFWSNYFSQIKNHQKIQNLLETFLAFVKKVDLMFTLPPAKCDY